jgi:hypothetical protein
VVYDPFLVEDKTSSSVSDIEETKDFGHDVVADAGSFTTVGFPSAPMDDYDSIDTAFDSNMNEVYKLAENQSTFTSASGEFDAFSAFVMEANDNNDAVAVITYENSPGGSLSEDYTYEMGLNFVPPAQAGNATETLLVGQRTDSVQTGAFRLPSNLYGSEDATQSRNSSIIDPATNFGATYAVGVGDTKVHPHAGYFVVINNEDSANQRLEQIAAVPGGLTVDEVDRQMNFTATNP